jgi:carboxylesterase
MTPKIIPSTEPFLMPGGETGCLLVHGFAGTPKEMRWMGENLHQRGYTVLGIRLTGHATQPEDMVRSRYGDWIASVEDGWNLLSGVTERIFLVGLSMGGALSLLMATRLKVAGVVSMSAPYSLSNDPRLKLAKSLSVVYPYLKKESREQASKETGYFDESLWDYHISYPVNPVRSLAELNDLLAEMRGALPKIRVPVLLIHSQDDGYVLPKNMPKIYEHLGAADKKMEWIAGSGHVVTEEPPRHQIYALADEFMQRVIHG